LWIADCGLKKISITASKPAIPVGGFGINNPQSTIHNPQSAIRMRWRLSNAISVLACLLATIVAALAQSTTRSTDLQEPDTQTANTQQTPKVVYTTPPKTSVARLKSGAPEDYEVRIKVAYTITAANYDDSMVGTLVFTIPEDARKKIAEVSGGDLTSIPASVARKDVVAGFQKGTACPEVNIDIGAMELDLAGTKLSFDRIVVAVIETLEEVPQHFCVWTRQINANRKHRGVISSLNRLITVEQ
jgi:hypothetical protein